MKKIYVDNSATTRVRDEVIEVMAEIMKNDFGNPSSPHSIGRSAKKLLEESRENIANVINVSPQEIVFTSGGTESNNLVIYGIKNLVEKKILKKEKHIITSKIEHSSVKELLEHLEMEGWKITWLSVDKSGFVDLEELKTNLLDTTALVSIIHANNEIGTIQNLNLISNVCKEKNVFFHSDAVQSFGKISIDLKKTYVDFMSISSHKIHGPKGVGALYINSRLSETVKLPSIFYGGGQENQIRPGTENLPGIVGFGLAAKLINSEMENNINYLNDLQSNLMKDLVQISEVKLTGPDLVLNSNFNNLIRVPGHVSFCVKDIEGENLVLQFDLKGVALSSGSACSSFKDPLNPKLQPSHVIKAIGVSEDFLKGSIRISFSGENTLEEVSYISKTLKDIMHSLKKLIF